MIFSISMIGINNDCLLLVHFSSLLDASVLCRTIICDYCIYTHYKPSFTSNIISSEPYCKHIAYPTNIQPL